MRVAHGRTLTNTLFTKFVRVSAVESDVVLKSALPEVTTRELSFLRGQDMKDGSHLNVDP